MNKAKTKYVKVTLLDANHVPGSVMFLFQGFMGNILHTGDFRYHQGMGFNIMRVFQRQNIYLKIDEIILDNTYCDPIYKFPKREYVIDWIIKIIQMERK